MTIFFKAFSENEATQLPSAQSKTEDKSARKGDETHKQRKYAKNRKERGAKMTFNSEFS